MGKESRGCSGGGNISKATGVNHDKRVAQHGRSTPNPNLQGPTGKLKINLKLPEYPLTREIIRLLSQSHEAQSFSFAATACEWEDPEITEIADNGR